MLTTSYAATVNKYSRRAAIVQIGWKTHAVSLDRRSTGRHLSPELTDTLVQIFSITAVAIIGTCLILLVIARIRDSSSS